jgi:NAD(P)-dependent dehydrogenase (short-subunit alcohol dehydrogenase family)
MDLGLKGRAALVTGASRGIGAAIARVLAEEGVHVALAARDGSLLAEVAREIRDQHGVRAEAIPADLSVPETPARVVDEAVTALGKLDILVNCAGATKRGDFFDLTEQDWSDGFALKFFGYVRMTRAAWPHLKAGNGVVINIVGVASRTPAADYTIAGSVNSALLNFGKAMADIGRRDGVRVNSVNPGYIRTDRLTTRLQDLAAKSGSRPEDIGRELCEKIGVRRFGEAEEIGRITAYLASDLGGYIEGASIDVDGGWTRGI